MTKVIEIIGLGRAGKSTQVELLENSLKSKGYSVAIIYDRERAEDLKIPFTEIVGYKLVFAAKALDQYFEHKDKVDYIIIERGWIDFKVWIEAERTQGHIVQERANQLMTTFSEYNEDVDKVICLLVDLEVAKERQEIILEKQDDKFIDFIIGDYAKSLKQAYSNFKDCVIVDGSLSKEDVHTKIVSIVEKV
ncbi:deoxynucleoside kinase [Candidatus Woesearchaeota archaeon]|jgi:thymidylate kinase|nr:deoxynucleoside kinase [Candidatus Woesearchaeota archaeon]MBT4110625.1 deoxynucleoside kinase [Candidatus Woesearchaeota archaeon]MBT4335851.1 deoxynucleoside kinase [Candidatus Woesearchaeota archaeon]MBT4469170.1 deoxynucleoside kinase [Candidatus Woesearchaeota archaeon]MBT6744511.1 deoxynucleoside kinase [Candidatus Woesearchaeota archaeon]